MELIEQYLQYLNEQNTALARRIRSGELKLSPEKIKELISKGMIKPWEQYEKGMGKGLAKQREKTGAKISPEIDPSIKSARYDPNENKIYIPKSHSKTEKILAGRHEYAEASAAKKGAYGALLGKPTLKSRLLGIKPEEKGYHGSPRVLRGEKALHDFIGPTYGQGKEHIEYRRKSGEYNYIEKRSKAGQNKDWKKAAKNQESYDKVFSEQKEKISDRLQNLNKLFKDPRTTEEQKQQIKFHIKNLKNELGRLIKAKLLHMKQTRRGESFIDLSKVK